MLVAGGSTDTGFIKSYYSYSLQYDVQWAYTVCISIGLFQVCCNFQILSMEWMTYT